MIPVGIFAKPPRPGLVKTRLIPDIGAARAARIYRYCLEYTLELVRHSGLDYELYLSEESDDHLFQHEQYSIQKGADLGARMLNALGEMISGHPDGAIIIGTDCLDIHIGHLQTAAQALSNNELVLLPAIDGGYALIGCSRLDSALFDGVTWSSERVLEQTVINAEKLNYRISLLETVRDIDTLQDLELYPELLSLITSN
jgi:hypothetical protein